MKMMVNRKSSAEATRVNHMARRSAGGAASSRTGVRRCGGSVELVTRQGDAPKGRREQVRVDGGELGAADGGRE